MFDWLQNPHGGLVLAAYGVALGALLALLLASWRRWARQRNRHATDARPR